jgi:GNAT superfamily N-acetyltransferase
VHDANLAESGILIRSAVGDDIDDMVEFRVRMFRELGWSDESRFDLFVPAARAHLLGSFSAETCNGFIAEETGADGVRRTVGTVAIVWQQVAPTVRNVSGRVAYVLGMFVVPERRRQGVARELMRVAIECATEKGAPLLTLHASETGRPLYERLGFTATTEMRLFTENALSSAWGPVDVVD